MEGEVKANGVAGCQRPYKMNLHHGMVGPVAIVRRDELHLLRKISVAVGGEMADGNAADFFFRIIAGASANAAFQVSFIRERRLRTKRIQIEMKGKCIERLPGKIFIVEGFGGVDGFLIGIDAGIDSIRDHPLRERMSGRRIGCN